MFMISSISVCSESVNTSLLSEVSFSSSVVVSCTSVLSSSVDVFSSSVVVSCTSVLSSSTISLSVSILGGKSSLYLFNAFSVHCYTR